MGTSEQNGQARWTPGAKTEEEARKAGREWGLAIAAQAVLIGGGHVRASRECQAWEAQGLISRDLPKEQRWALCDVANKAAAEAFALARTDEEAQAAGTRWAEVDGDAGILGLTLVARAEVRGEGHALAIVWHPRFGGLHPRWALTIALQGFWAALRQAGVHTPSWWLVIDETTSVIAWSTLVNEIVAAIDEESVTTGEQRTTDVPSG